MNKEYIIISVKHTGTNFLQKLVKPILGDVEVCHWSNGSSVKRFSGYKILSPIRNPFDCFVTWYSRDRYGYEFIKEWNIFNEFFKSGKIAAVLPIDTLDKNQHLNKLSEVIGGGLITDWSPVESMQRHTPPKIDLSEVYNLPIVKHFYE